MGPQAIVIHQKENMSTRGTREYSQSDRIWKHLKTALWACLRRSTLIVGRLAHCGWNNSLGVSWSERREKELCSSFPSLLNTPGWRGHVTRCWLIRSYNQLLQSPVTRIPQSWCIVPLAVSENQPFSFTWLFTVTGKESKSKLFIVINEWPHSPMWIYCLAVNLLKSHDPFLVTSNK